MVDRRHFALAVACCSLPALAQPIPPTTTLWSGFPVGGLGDQITRPLIDRLKGRYPSVLIYDVKAGAGGRIAADFVRRAAPDGATLLQVPSSPMTTLYPCIPTAGSWATSRSSISCR